VERFISFVGLLAMMVLAWLMSENRRKMNFRLIVAGGLLQVMLGMLLLWTVPGRAAFVAARHFVTQLNEFSNEGAKFLFGKALVEQMSPFEDCIAFFVLPNIIFFSSLMAVLFHLGVMQRVVRVMARVMVWVMDTSGTESLCAAGEVFLGMTTTPLMVRPYLETMTRSELMAMMTAGMATIAGGVMAAYAAMGADAGHLLAASLMAAPASLVIAKIMVPETEKSPTKGAVSVDIPRQDANLFDAACRGASEGMELAIGVAAMLIAFVAMVYLVNWGLGGAWDLYNRVAPHVGFYPLEGEPLTLQRILGWIMAPIAWILGIEWKDAQAVGQLLGTKTVLNEFLAYVDLVKLKETISDRSFTIATYALCGFANFGSVAIMIGGIGALVPTRRKDFARYALRSLIGGTLASFMTAAIAGMLI
jgi:CNT family concentrative nucleoside transporter